MKTIGLIGGIGWLSSADYYRIINEEVSRRLGGLHSARIVMTSLDFAQVRELVDTRRHDALLDLFSDTARRLEAAGADVLALCSNAAHIDIAKFQASVKTPFLHIADALGAAARSAGLRRIGLLGTRDTMERPFMREALESGGLIEVLTPSKPDREWLDDMIFGALERGLQTEAHTRGLLTIIDRLADSGADGIVLGCTELPLLMRGVAASLPCLDSAALHALALVDFALRDQ